MNATVFFADGDAEPRVATVPMIQDLISDEPDKTVNLTLSQPGGCAALGTQTTATLTIRDDDTPSPPPPPPPTSSFLDPTFGSEGKASAAFGATPSAMALQSDGKIVMVGGTFSDSILARYNADGSLDASFGVGGKVTSGVVGLAFAVTIQPDGKIVVAGDFSVPSPLDTNFSDFAVARYNTNGALDTTFGNEGTLTIDFFFNDVAESVAIQPDGKIVLSGFASGNPDGYGVARVLP